jgi:magnesium transporter
MQDIEKPKSDSGTGDRLEPGEIEKDVMGLHQRLGRRQGLEEAVKLTDSFGLEVAIAVLDQVVDSVFESLNAIRLKADRLEGNLLRDAGRSGAASDELPQMTLNLRRLLRQVRWSFLPADEISELQSGPFLNLSDQGIKLQLDDLVREANRAVETVRDVIQQVQQVVELSDSLKTQRLDGTIHAFTVAATVLLVPTLVAGLWGMNFAYIPGANLRQGFWVGLLILAIIAVGAAFAISWYLNRTRKIRPGTATNKHTTP